MKTQRVIPSVAGLLTMTVPVHDGDGASNEQEWNALADHPDRAGPFRIVSTVGGGLV